MLKILQPAPAASNAGAFQDGGLQQQFAQEYIDFGAAISAARRQWPVVAAIIVFFLLLGFVTVTAMAPRYTATASVLLDRHSNLLPEQSSSLTSLFDSEAATLSQIEIFKSGNVAGAVVDALELTANPEFEADGLSTLQTLKAILMAPFGAFSGPAGEVDQVIRRQQAIEGLLNNIAVTRVGQTFVLNLSYTSRSPKLAAEIVNAFNAEFIADAVRAKAEASGRASEWLKIRLEELKSEVLAADTAVQNFSAGNGLVTAGGQLVTDQQMATINAMLMQAESETAKAEAQLGRIEAILASGEAGASVADALGSPVINTLQERYAEAAKHEQEVVNKLGPEHIQARRLRREMDQYKQSITEELGRIAATYRSDLAISQARRDDMRREFEAAEAASKSAGHLQVKLRALQQEADNYRGLYQSYLERHQQLRQQQSFPVSDARVITSAHAALKPSLPRKPLLIGVFAAIGIMLGLAIAAIREFSDRSLHSAEDVLKQLGLPLIGYLGDQSNEVQGRRGKNSPSMMARLAYDYPDSAFAETLRNAVISLATLEKARPLVVGVVSTLPGEGSSTVAANLACMAAQLGNRTVLVDSDWRTASLTRRLMPTIPQETHTQESHESIRLLRPAATSEGLVLAVPRSDRQGRTLPLADAGLAAAIEAVRDQSDLVIADFAALGPYSDALGAETHVDAFVLVVHWGKTSRQDIQGTLRRSPQVFEKCLGVIFNRTDRSRLAKYQGAWSGETAIAGLLLANPAGARA